MLNKLRLGFGTLPRKLLKVVRPGFLKFYVRNSISQVGKAYQLYRLIRENPTLKVGEGVQILSPDLLTVGQNVLVQKGTILQCGGAPWSNCQGYKGYIRIGDDSVISPYCIFYGTGGVEIGKRFDCGPNVMIFSSRTCYDLDAMGSINKRRRLQKVTIGDDVIIFGGVIINIGICIGDGAVIGAGSVVLSDVPPKEVWAGAPAHFIHIRDEDAL